MYISKTFSKFIKMCNHCPDLISDISITDVMYVANSCTHAQPTNLLSVSMDFPVLDVSHKWNHTTGGLLCVLLSRDTVFSHSPAIVACIGISFLSTDE